MAPFVPSWLANGTSALIFFAGGGAPGPPTTKPGFPVRGSVDADLDDEFEIQAACAVRYGTMAVRGLAVRVLAKVAIWRDELLVPRSAVDAVERTVDSIINDKVRSKFGWRNWVEEGSRVKRVMVQACGGSDDGQGRVGVDPLLRLKSV